jgi:hypothetical protein
MITEFSLAELPNPTEYFSIMFSMSVLASTALGLFRDNIALMTLLVSWPIKGFEDFLLDLRC